MFVRSRVIIESQELQIQNLNAEIAALRTLLAAKNELVGMQQNEIFDLTQKVRNLSNRLDDLTQRNREGTISYG